MSEPQSAPAEMDEHLLARLLHQRLLTEESLVASERETIAYRIADVMLAAKELYTRTLPRLLGEGNPSEAASLEDELSGMRMGLLHIRDLVTDFDNAFLDAMFHERQKNPDQVYDDWREPDEGDEEGWTADDLGVTEEELAQE